MPIGTADQSSLRYLKETAWGVEPVSTTPMQLLRVTKEGLDNTRNFTESAELTGDRQLTTMQTTDADGGGDIDFQLTYGSFDDMFEGALSGTWTANVLKNGATLRSFALEKKISDVTAPVYMNWQGAIFDHMKLDMKPGAFVMGSCSAKAKLGTAGFASQAEAAPVTAGAFVVGTGYRIKTIGTTDFTLIGAATNTVGVTFSATGAGVGTGTAAPSLTGTPVDTNPIFSSVADITALQEGGTGITQVTALTLDSNQNTRMLKSIGTLGPGAAALGIYRLTGTLTAYFQDKSLLDKFLNATTSSIQVQIGTGANKLYVLLIPKVQYTKATVVAGAINTDLMVSMTWTALKDTVTTQAMIQITRTP